MRALFIELPSFERHRRDYLDDEAFSALQQWLMQCPDAGDLIQRVVQPLPLTRNFALGGSQFTNGLGHLCCSLHFVLFLFYIAIESC